MLFSCVLPLQGSKYISGCLSLFDYLIVWIVKLLSNVNHLISEHTIFNLALECQEIERLVK